MLIEERKIDVEQLRQGMYVCRLDRDWTETPFPLQGFLVDGDSQIEMLRRYCAHVYIDVEQGIGVDEKPAPMMDDALRGAVALEGPRRPHPVTRSVAEEAAQAADALQGITERATGIIEALRSGGSVSDVDVRDAVEPVVASLVRNPDALFWLQALRGRGEYAYGHAVNCCALAAALGRQLGLPAEELNALAAGGMLLDIGMTSVPAQVIDHARPLDGAERNTMQEHVAHGVALYRDSGMRNPIVISMLQFHHERHDGSGYPMALEGAAIPLAARIAAIVDTYDAMVTQRPHRPAVARHDALQMMYRERNCLFQDELIEQFMQCLGVYPVGSLVELNSGEVAIVMAQNPTRRLRPALMLLTSPDKGLRSHFEPLDLLLADKGGLPQAGLHIVRGLHSGAYGLEPSELYL